MSRAIVWAAACVMWLCAGTASGSVGPARSSSEQPSTEVQDELLKLKQAFADAGSGNYAKAGPEIDGVLAGLGFDELPPDLRFQTLNLASALAFEGKQYAKAHGFAIRATGFNQASGATWMIRLGSAIYTGDYPDSGRCVEALAKHWPDQLGDVRPESIAQLHRSLRIAHEADIDRAMLDALFDARWQANGTGHDTLWRDLALSDIEHGELDRAATVATRIRSSQTALSMRVDKRFDPITRAKPQAFDVGRLLDGEILAARAQMKAHPDQLEAVQRLQDLLIEAGRNAEVIAVSDPAVAHAERGDGPKAYVDFGENYNWVLNQRSLAYAHEGRWGEAASEMTRAAKRPENGGFNVSQSINLAGLYTDMNEPDKSSAAILEPGEMSPYGTMQLRYVRLQIAIEKNDARAIAEHMAYLREHRTDDIATWQRALLRHGDLDAAAALLIERLNAPDWRNQALVAMQHYLPGSPTPVIRTMDERWAAVTSRADVQAALAKVGRVEQFGITTPAY